MGKSTQSNWEKWLLNVENIMDNTAEPANFDGIGDHLTIPYSVIYVYIPEGFRFGSDIKDYEKLNEEFDDSWDEMHVHDPSSKFWELHQAFIDSNLVVHHSSGIHAAIINVRKSIIKNPALLRIMVNDAIKENSNDRSISR